MDSLSPAFYVVGGTLGLDAPCYVERRADKELYRALLEGDFCYLLTSRQMGKSSMVARTAQKLRRAGVTWAMLDLTGIGHNLTVEQWFDGLVARLEEQLRLADELDDFWKSHSRLGPCQRFFTVLREAVLTRIPGPIVIFIDELDFVRSLPFRPDECFAGLRECFNSRSTDPELRRLTFCLIGVASPSDLIQSPDAPLFNVGRRIDINDFTPREALPLAAGLEGKVPTRFRIERLFQRLFYWTEGHPYLTQRLLQEIARVGQADRAHSEEALVDRLCQELFLSPAARGADDNLLCVRHHLLQRSPDLATTLDLYETVRRGQPVAYDDLDPHVQQLVLAGIVREQRGQLHVRNRIYREVFDAPWVAATRPVAELEVSDGQRVRIHDSCTIGRHHLNQLVLQDQGVSRHHALVERRVHNQIWIVDLGSRNGTIVNGTRPDRPMRLRHGDQIVVGPFRIVLRQLHPPPSSTTPSQTPTETRDRCFA